MTPDMIDLARRAVACRLWRWTEGMLSVRVEDGQAIRVVQVAATTDAYVPDFSDPATLGCLLARLRTIYGKASLTTQFRGKGRWWVGEYESNPSAFTLIATGDGEVDAMVKALEKTR